MGIARVLEDCLSLLVWFEVLCLGHGAYMLLTLITAAFPAGFTLESPLMMNRLLGDVILEIVWVVALTPLKPP